MHNRFYAVVEHKARTGYNAAGALDYRRSDDLDLDGPSRTALGDFVDQLTRSLPTSGRALDLACGTCRYSYRITRPITVIGMDLSFHMLQLARHPVAGERVACRTHLTCGSLYALPFQDHRFDVVYSIGVIGHHLPLDAYILQEAHRLLIPGGLFGFSVDSAESPRTTSWKHELALRLRRVLPSIVRPWWDARLHEFRIHEHDLRRLLEASPFIGAEISRMYSPTGRIDFLVTARA